MQKIDAHQHFWEYNEKEYPWIDDRMEILRKDFLPEDLQKELNITGYSGSIAIQARQILEENEFLLELAENSDTIKGVVGWVDLQSQAVDEQLEKYSAIPKFCGVRHVIQDEPDDQFMFRPSFLRGVSLLQYYNLTYDILILPKQLINTIHFIDRLPNQKFVIDHIAKPLIKERVMEPWGSLMNELSKRENVWCKLSGMVTEADWEIHSKETFTRYLEVVYQSFGPDRLMAIVEDFINPDDAEKILGLNALEFYGKR
jgi:L-fuconolactonase